MAEEAEYQAMPLRAMVSRFALMLGVSGLLGVCGESVFKLNLQQSTACAVFAAIILGTLLFWGFRLAIAFLGLAVLVLTGSLTIPQFVQSSALDVILFLVGMMVVVGALRDLGFFTWVVQRIVAMPDISGRKFIAVTATASALLACAVDEVTAIIFISTLIFQVCSRLKLNPTPYIMISVLATNVGSAGTMMGNPVGIFIGTRAGLHFGDFMLWSFPLMLLALAVTIVLTLFFFRRSLRQFDINLAERLARNLSLAPKVEVPFWPGAILLIATVTAIGLHHQLETLCKLQSNSMLIVAPLVCAGVVMLIRGRRARHYIERDVDWWTLLFFMLLFAVAGTLEHTGVAEKMATGFTGICGSAPGVLVPSIMLVSAVGSAFVDNVIFVAAFAPVIEELGGTMNAMPLWWALLFGACFGGNITMIGSTANIVALGMLEKKSAGAMGFFRWLKVGLPVALTSLAVCWLGLTVLSPWMPDRACELDCKRLNRDYQGKTVTVEAGVLPGELAWSVLERTSGLPEVDKEAVTLVKLTKPGIADDEFNLTAAVPKKLQVSGRALKLFSGKLYGSGDGPRLLVVESAQEIKH